VATPDPRPTPPRRATPESKPDASPPGSLAGLVFLIVLFLAGGVVGVVVHVFALGLFGFVAASLCLVAVLGVIRQRAGARPR
jgi:hypothetical protein